MKPELKKLLLLNLPYLLFVYLFAKCGQAYRLAAGADASAKLLHLTSGISAAFANPLPSLHPFDLCVGVVGAVAVRLIVYSKGKNAKKYRKGEEYGSARWGTAKDIAPYIDPKFENNILLTQTERLTMTGRPKDPKTARNKNVLVIGGDKADVVLVKGAFEQADLHHVTAYSALVFDNDGSHISGPYLVHHSVQAGPLEGRSPHPVIGEVADISEAIFSGVVLQDALLIFYGHALVRPPIVVR